MRTPLQGGLPLVDTVDGAVVEIACDESGFSGTNLLDPASPLITHAGVDLSVDEAAPRLHKAAHYVRKATGRRDSVVVSGDQVALFPDTEVRVDETVQEIDRDSIENLPYGLDNGNYQWVDLDGEGLSGVLTEQANGWFTSAI